MKITVQVVIDAQDGTPPTVEQVAAITRDDLAMAGAGVALTEAHEVLSGIQHHLVIAQAAAAAVAGQRCGSCGRPRARKDTRHIVLRTLFGTLRLDSPRFRPARALAPGRRPSARWRPCCPSAPRPSCCCGRRGTPL